ncbi:MupA/Atu3671 family FMN-dependent luciferase-like monooxygenase [Streptomyces sp. NL15-2K]|uniref:MupA/Atu3671 family FMN-dependent luciferase-like monooxygenase n=1 Tax=Streptomyces sp. NL15-2K TaxID=376149 RepID=UPI000F57D22B|nr:MULTISPECIES: MupA/Atu3671 family FMN-dependent luciferase-like monooxygenase [Actinomycetes]WKX12612.1 LLM class flavin-dependent oxidoreductase [Kutzneria buriramensis]GCB43184.1 non-ribosomal peptide synthetase [Streptomyces sp. NL15-2K]
MSDGSFLDAGQLAQLKAKLRSGTTGTPAPAPVSASAPAPERQRDPAASSLPDLGVIFFSGLSGDSDPYDLLLDVSRFVDGAGFGAIWTPERHFTEAGGAYPNPAVLGSALAVITENVRIRSGSVNLPLHDILRVAEEWALVDNLSGGRVDLAVAPGWHSRDFVLNPEGYESRGQALNAAREQLQQLWRGVPVERTDPAGERHDILTFPRPVQSQLPVWLTSSKSVDSWRFAGEQGLNVLSALINFGPAELQKRIDVYREARARAGLDPDRGVVSLMLHTYVGVDAYEAVERVRTPMTEYLSSFVTQHATSGQSESQDKSRTLQNLDADRDEFLEMVFQRYVSSSSLIGDVKQARQTLEGFRDMGVDEVACLVDFGLSKDEVLASLTRLSSLLEKGA